MVQLLKEISYVLVCIKCPKKIAEQYEPYYSFYVMEAIKGKHQCYIY